MWRQPARHLWRGGDWSDETIPVDLHAWLNVDILPQEIIEFPAEAAEQQESEAGYETDATSTKTTPIGSTPKWKWFMTMAVLTEALKLEAMQQAQTKPGETSETPSETNGP